VPPENNTGRPNRNEICHEKDDIELSASVEFLMEIFLMGCLKSTYAETNPNLFGFRIWDWEVWGQGMMGPDATQELHSSPL